MSSASRLVGEESKACRAIDRMRAVPKSRFQDQGGAAQRSATLLGELVDDPEMSSPTHDGLRRFPVVIRGGGARRRARRAPCSAPAADGCAHGKDLSTLRATPGFPMIVAVNWHRPVLCSSLRDDEAAVHCRR
jgi:hypothetical protein